MNTDNNQDRDDNYDDSRVDLFIQDQLTKAEGMVDIANRVYMDALSSIYGGILSGFYRVHSGEDARGSSNESYKSLQTMYVTLDVKDNDNKKTKDVLRATMSVRGDDDTIFFSIHKITGCVNENDMCGRKFRHEMSATSVGEPETGRTFLIRRLFNLMSRVCETEEEVLSGLVAKKAYDDILSTSFGKSLDIVIANEKKEQ